METACTRVCLCVLSSRGAVRCIAQSGSTGAHGPHSAEGAPPARELGAALGPGWEPGGRGAADARPLRSEPANRGHLAEAAKVWGDSS